LVPIAEFREIIDFRDEICASTVPCVSIRGRCQNTKGGGSRPSVPLAGFREAIDFPRENLQETTPPCAAPGALV
jgi:hypothetical protein